MSSQTKLGNSVLPVALGAWLLAYAVAVPAEPVCRSWAAPAYAALRSLSPCGEPVESRAGSLCMVSQLRCSDGSLAQFVDALLNEVQDGWQVGEFGDGLALTGQAGNESWAVFWDRAFSEHGRLTLLVSRLRPALDRAP